MRTPTKTITAVSLTAALALSLGACSSQSSSSPPEDATTSGETGVSTGEFSGTIDGEAFIIDQPIVSCIFENGTSTVYASSMVAPLSSNFSLTIKESNKVIAVTASLDDEPMLYFMEARGVGHAEVTVEGSTYTVIGEAPTELKADPSAPLRRFAVTATCR